MREGRDGSGRNILGVRSGDSATPFPRNASRMDARMVEYTVRTGRPAKLLVAKGVRKSHVGIRLHGFVIHNDICAFHASHGHLCDNEYYFAYPLPKTF